MTTPSDEAAVAAQLGRDPRGLRAVAHRCPCGQPDVVETAPRLPDGTPFPTLYYLTCPRATAAISGLEAAGLMREMTARLAVDPLLRSSYQQAHRDYLARRDVAAAAEGLDPLPAGTQSAGGMPDRVKCLHALAAHELAAPGANPFGREALDAAGQWWSRCCLPGGRPPVPRSAPPGGRPPVPRSDPPGGRPPVPPDVGAAGPDRKGRDPIRPSRTDESQVDISRADDPLDPPVSKEAE